MILHYQGVYTGGIGGGTGNTIQIHSVGFPAYSFFVLEQVYGADGKPIENLLLTVMVTVRYHK